TPRTPRTSRTPRTWLHALCHPSPLRRMLPIWPGHFAAQPRSGEDLPGIADARGIERAAQPLHRVEIGVGEHFGHIGRLVGADAMLACNGSAGVDTVLQNL